MYPRSAEVECAEAHQTGVTPEREQSRGSHQLVQSTHAMRGSNIGTQTSGANREPIGTNEQARNHTSANGDEW